MGLDRDGMAWLGGDRSGGAVRWRSEAASSILGRSTMHRLKFWGSGYVACEDNGPMNIQIFFGRKRNISSLINTMID
jgi:hypothetical protein